MISQIAQTYFLSLAIYASTLHGISRLNGANRLFNKESNRFESLKKELNNFGIKVELEENEMVIYGGQFAAPSRPVKTYGDHRIAMAFGILKVILGSNVQIEDPEVVKKSYPDFWQDLDVILSQDLTNP